MGNCKNVCKLCDRLVISQAINVSGNTLIVNLPAGNYENNSKYCIIFAQTIPSSTPIGANVVFTIGTGTQQYPLVNKCCRPVTACGVRTRTKYSVCVETTSTSAIFRMIGEPCCQPNNNLRSVNGTAPVTTATTNVVVTTKGAKSNA